ncbi:10158_t:CDS:2 [Ambispora leptoticha]|uniref:10158_t:CDS:1 n=1 Tax=Ambispora leptoticha TaxID=144679 RepID=A0A9N8VPF7_9GLOM|nr:10158_t:CDS:2 [Ambispora leptoticha]
MNLFKFLTITIFMVCFLWDIISAKPLPLLSDDTVLLYREPYFGGDVISITLDPTTCTQVPPEYVSFSSARVLNGKCALFYREFGCQDQPHEVCREDPLLPPDYLHQIRSIQLELLDL